jgi:hypothetical protein
MKYELDLSLQIINPRTRYRIARVDKTRLLGFPEHDTFVLQEGDNEPGYADFLKRYGKENIDAEPAQIILCNPEQLKEISSLVDRLKIEEKEIEKILKRGNAEKFEELTEDHANKFIKWLNNKLKGEK